MTLPWLTDSEVDDLTAGVRTNAARARHLEDMGLCVNRKPNGRPLVMRAHAEAVLSGLNKREIEEQRKPTGPAPVGPNRSALVQMFSGRRAA